MSTEKLLSHFNLVGTLHAPAPISALSLSDSGHVAAGSDDGSVRLYHTSATKVLKAVTHLGSEVSSLRFVKGNRDVWVACGRQALLFPVSSQKLILTPSDALLVFELGEDEDDVLNELALSDNQKHLAFSTDSGTVGVVDLTTKRTSRMKVKHENLCGTVNFIPDRPSELVSGGYDSALLHFDFQQGTLLSRHHIKSSPSESGVSLSPPFVLSMSVSSSGGIVVGTADGQLWIGTNGEKRPATVGNKKKRNRKWEGLKEEGSLLFKVAEGPIVATTFVGTDELISSSLLGSVTQHRLTRSAIDDTVTVTPVFTFQAHSIAKVNTLAANDDFLILGGFGENGKGIVEIWRQSPRQNITNDTHNILAS